MPYGKLMILFEFLYLHFIHVAESIQYLFCEPK